MNTGASITSVAVLHDWYAALAEFRKEAQDALTSLALALQHAEAWLDEQQKHWHRQIRLREEAIVHAKAELATREISNTRGHPIDCTVQIKNLRRAKAALEEAEEGLAAVRRWMLRLPREICDKFTGPIGYLTGFLDSELPSGLALLSRQLTSLAQYADLRPPQASAPVVSSDKEKP